MPRFPVTTAVLLVALAGCGGQRDPSPSLEDSPTAAAVVRELEHDLKGLAGLPAAEQEAAQRAFGERLRRDLEPCRGTRYENKPLYWLAQWTYTYGGEAGQAEVLRLLDRLDILPHPAFRNAGRDLRVQVLLRQGRVSEARAIAQQLEHEVPEFGALRRVEFHDLVGQPAPPLPGTVVSGSGEVSDQSFLLVAFLGLPDAAAEGWLKPLAAAGGGRVRTVAVATAGDLLTATAVASAWGVEVRWLRLADPGLAAWRLPALPTAVLLGPGPQRVVLAADPQPWQLEKLRK